MRRTHAVLDGSSLHSAGHGSVKLKDPLTGRRAAVKGFADRLAAALMLARGDHAAALPVLTAMVDAHPSEHWALADLGWCQFRLGQLEVRHIHAKYIVL